VENQAARNIGDGLGVASQLDAALSPAQPAVLVRRAKGEKLRIGFLRFGPVFRISKRVGALSDLHRVVLPGESGRTERGNQGDGDRQNVGISGFHGVTFDVFGYF
jgi:hypothetical protein